MLIVMEDWDVHLFFKGFFNMETLRSLDVFKVNTTKSWFHRLCYLNKLLGAFDSQVNIKHVDVSKCLKENTFAFHYRLAS